MYSRAIIWILIVTQLTYLSGCTTTQQETLTKAELSPSTQGRIVDAVLKDGAITRFNNNGGKYVERTTGDTLYRAIVGVTADGKPVELDPDKVLAVHIARSKANVLGTVMLIIIAIPVVFVAGALIYLSANPPRSCPFIYSFDGKQYTFDAQAYAGAVTAGLKRMDYSRLDHLKAVNGSYTVMMRNDPINETQYTDEASLLVVDHDPLATVAVGYDGTPYAFTNSTPPLSVRDENGSDITRFFKTRDQAAWESQLPADSSYKTLDYRHHLTFTFPKPAGARTVRLLFNGGTSYWGSMMIERLLTLHGDHAEAWLQGIDRGGPEARELFQFIEGQELYHLKVNVFDGTAWRTRGIIKSSGGIAIEDRTMELDVRDVPGESLKIQLQPPRGFWKLDYFGVAYDNVTTPDVQYVPAFTAGDQQGRDVRELLRANDNRYQVMNRSGDLVNLLFQAPPQREGTTRSLFLRTSGYYSIHLQAGTPDQGEAVIRMLKDPKVTVQFAMDEYLKWRSLLSVSK